MAILARLARAAILVARLRGVTMPGTTAKAGRKRSLPVIAERAGPLPRAGFFPRAAGLGSPADQTF
jgi:hypothetical protein